MTIVPWTDEQNRLLEQLCGKKLKSARIAAEINWRTGSHFTRNGVIGRARRAGIELPVAAGSHGPRVKFRGAPPLEPTQPTQWKPGRILLRCGWLDGGFR